MRPEMVAACVAPVLPLAAWFAWSRARLDLPLGPLTALHDNWGHHAEWPWQVIADSVASIATGTKPEELGNLLMVGVVLAALPLMWRRLPPSWTAYTGVTLLLTLCGEAQWTPLMSWMRYAAVLVPVFALVALGLARLPVWVRLLLAAVALGLQLWLFHLFVHFIFIA